MQHWAPRLYGKLGQGALHGALHLLKCPPIGPHDPYLSSKLAGYVRGLDLTLLKLVYPKGQQPLHHRFAWRRRA